MCTDDEFAMYVRKEVLHHCKGRKQQYYVKESCLAPDDIYKTQVSTILESIATLGGGVT